MRDQGTPKDICGEAKLFSFPFERLPRRLGWTDHAGGRQVLFLARMTHNEGGVRVCGDAVLRYFWCGFAVIFILTRGIAVFKH